MRTTILLVPLLFAPSLARLALAEEHCCIDLPGTLQSFNSCPAYGEEYCQDGDGRCGLQRQNGCIVQPGCTDICGVLPLSVLVDVTSCCFYDEDEWECLCEGIYVYTWASLIGCDYA